MSEYKVKILKPNNWRRHPVGRLDISVGQPYHEGEKLKAAIQWAEEKFSHLIISVADTLQRYNYMADGMDVENAYNKSYQDGADWITRNRNILSGCTIIRWDQRLRSPVFRQYLKKTLDMSGSSAVIKTQLRDSALEYLSRKSLPPSTHRHDYLIEELAVFDMLFNIEPAADIYPGSLLPFWQHPAYSKAAFTRIDFTRRKTPGLSA